MLLLCVTYVFNVLKIVALELCLLTMVLVTCQCSYCFHSSVSGVCVLP